MNSPTLSRRAMIAGVSASAALAAAPARAAAAAASPAALLDDLAWQLLALSPTQATALGVDTGAHAALRAALDDRSPAGLAATRRFLAQALDRLAAVPRDGLDRVTLTSLAVAQSAFRTALDGMALPYGDVAIGGWRNTPYAVIQNVGGYLDIPQMLDGDQPLHDAADADAYLSRLSATPALLDGELERIRAARAMGLVAPDFLLDRTIAALGQCLAHAGRADGPFVGPLARKRLPGAHVDHAVQIATDTIVPALERQLAEIRLQRAHATGDAGMMTRPHGAEWYAWALRASTTTRRSAEDLHAMGVAQLADLHARMDTLLTGLGLTQGSVAERAMALQRRPELGFSNDDAGRAQIVAYMQGRIDAIRPRLDKAFTRLVRGNLEIRRMPAAQEPGAPAAYGGPGSIDGTVPGKIWVNLGDPSIHNKVTIPDLVFHEGIPGHVWQGEYAQQLPLIRSILAFNAYSEGWALYAEQLADELGMYDDDAPGKLGYLMGLSWRAVRLVVDTGIHAKGWSRARALQEFTAATGLPASNAASEIDRYCSWPGQACGYKVGQTEIVDLRHRAQTALGAKYDLRAFNQVVVDGGNVPLDVLAGNVDRYIARG
ncbi:DUF885 domain-containing protein [Novosphingobium acidiphilum]|uniref:DUF885 domain-containing protein n=1 Tax=Novosphingobium acidiphilum TaxID=505248 RepID=UPI00041CDAD5|nr:DUF885 domain-containing protein [Novosphingobium acidiphilum]